MTAALSALSLAIMAWNVSLPSRTGRDLVVAGVPAVLRLRRASQGPSGHQDGRDGQPGPPAPGSSSVISLHRMLLVLGAMPWEEWHVLKQDLIDGTIRVPTPRVG